LATTKIQTLLKGQQQSTLHYCAGNVTNLCGPSPIPEPENMFSLYIHVYQKILLHTVCRHKSVSCYKHLYITRFKKSASMSK